jgi:hypothetical protein
VVLESHAPADVGEADTERRALDAGNEHAAGVTTQPHRLRSSATARRTRLPGFD